MTERPRIRARAPMSSTRRGILTVALLAAIGLAPYLVTYSQPAPELGLLALGGLRPCPQSPNCVCSDWRYILASNAARHLKDRPPRPAHFVEPLELPEDSASEWEALVEIIGRQPGVTVVESANRYLRAERRTTIYGLIDDFELVRLFDGTVLLRSAARIAYSDFGRNRRFVERIRTEFQKRPQAQWF